MSLLRLCSRFRLFCWRLCFLRWGKFKAAVTTSQHNFNVEVFWRLRLFGFWKVVQIFQSEIFKNVKSAWWRKRLFSPSASAAADYYATVSDRNHQGGRRFDLQGGRGRGFSFKSSITVEEGCCPPIRGQRGVTSHWSLLRQTWAHFKSTFTSASGSVRYVHEMWAGLDTGPESEPTYWQRTRSKWAAQEKQPLS